MQYDQQRDKRLKKKKWREPQGPVGLQQKKTYNFCHESSGRIDEVSEAGMELPLWPFVYMSHTVGFKILDEKAVCS